MKASAFVSSRLCGFEKRDPRSSFHLKSHWSSLLKKLTVLVPINRRLRRSICNSKRPFLRCSSGLLRQKATSRQQQPFSHCWFFLHLTTAPRSRERRGFSYYYSQLEEGWEASKRRRRPAFLKQLKDQKFHHYYQPSFTAEHLLHTTPFC